MNILVGNDDGIRAKGINVLVKELSKSGNVYVFAPSGEMSCQSHSLTLRAEIEVKSYEMEGAAEAYEVSGKPADCIKIGLHLLGERGIKVDLVCTGINHGANIGTDIMYSGTASAAAEGVFKGIPSMAVSVIGLDACEFDTAAELATKYIPKALELGGRNLMVNINTPNRKREDIKGIKPARIGVVDYIRWFDIKNHDDGTRSYAYSKNLKIKPYEDEGMDTRLVHDGYATVSLVKYDQNDEAAFDELCTWNFDMDGVGTAAGSCCADSAPRSSAESPCAGASSEAAATETAAEAAVRIRREDAIFAVIDFQEKLMSAMHHEKELEDRVCRMARGAKALGLQTAVTQQYTKGLGATIEPLAESLGAFEPIEKSTFSAYKERVFREALEKSGKKTVLVAGIETHICVEQTVLDLLGAGYKVVVLGDCVSSRDKKNVKLSLNRMAAAGAVVTGYESALYEMLGGSTAPEFKEISKIVK